MNTTTTQLVTYNVSEQVIKDLQQKAQTLEIQSIDDKENYNLVDTARKEAKRLKIEIENRRKELKADALTFGRLVDSEAAKYSKPLEEIETILAAKQKLIDDEKARIKLEKEQEAKLPNRKLLLAEFENVPTDQEIKILSDLEFQGLIQKLVGERQAKIQAEQEKERQRLDQERKEYEAKLETERLSVQAEQEKLLEAERAKQRELDKIEQDKRDADLAIEKAKLDAARKAFEAEQEAQRQVDLQKEQDRIQALEAEKSQRITDWKVANNYNAETDIVSATPTGFVLYRLISEISNI